MRPCFVVFALCATPLSFAPLAAQGVFATKVIAFDTKGNAGGGSFDPKNALGAPSSATSNVHSLGVDGWLTLGFDVVITNGPGADFIVFENPFRVGSQVYSEAVFVEVSSNGTDFARFPTRYSGPSTSGGPFATGYVGWYEGFAGIKPHLGGAPGVDPADVVQVGGDSFDLEDLRNHPLVLANKLDLNRVIQIRLVDVVAGISRDTAGRIIQDPTSGSADIDAVSVIHHVANTKGTGPFVVLDIPPSGDLTLTIGDPNGLVDLDPSSLRMALDGLEFPPDALISVMTIKQLTGNKVTLGLGGSLPPQFTFHLGVSVKDRAGDRSGQNRVR
ncbi:MAG: hypothetical protein KDC87_21945 [Planctomycetes bacterium]|nr:hypothetical protein [Planctomycetota bacterium]MCB9888683.1 hypothetical protein [Planctomycetota bacterium]MCB9889964.1 hypothetical protein [Planctomycetota bacterium]